MAENEKIPGQSVQIKIGDPQLDLRGARIDGNVDLVVSTGVPLPWIRLDGASINGDLVIRGEGAASPAGAPLPEAVAQIEARGMRVEGDVRIENVAVQGVVLNNARIAGDLRLSCVAIQALSGRSDRDALRCRDLEVKGSLFIRGLAASRSLIAGRLYLAGARVSGTVEFLGVDFAPPDPAAASPEKYKALTLANATIGGDLAWLEKGAISACTTRGNLNADSCHVGGRLRIALVSKGDWRFSMKACAIDAALQIKVQPPSGSDPQMLTIDAHDASSDAIEIWGYKDDPEVPDTPKTWTLFLSGMAYAGLAGSKGLVRGNRATLDEDFLNWFCRHVVGPSAVRTDSADFSPQPYQRFIALCRSEGFNDVADRAVVAWIERARGRGFHRFLFTLFGVTSKYGLWPGRALISLLSMWFLCSLLIGGLSIWRPNSFVDPEPQPLPGSGIMTRVVGVPDRPDLFGVSFVSEEKPASFDCAVHINPFVYALDIMLPLADFRQEGQCPQRGWDSLDIGAVVTSSVIALLRIVGVILSALLLLTLSGINRRIWR